jgi:hypothetical protein
MSETPEFVQLMADYGDVEPSDINGVACTVYLIRRRDRGELGVGYVVGDPLRWFVYDRANAESPWHQQSGPYTTYEDATRWILTADV